MSATTRLIAYLVVPTLVAVLHIALSKTAKSPARRVEILSLYVFGVMIGASGLSGFIAYFFLSDLIAESIGWPAGNPFQQEVAFMNLAMGILGLIAIVRRGEFRLATAIGAAIISYGATIVHIIDIVNHANFAPGNVFINISNILKPTAAFVLIALANRLAARGEPGDLSTDWLGPQINIAVWVAVGIGTGFGVGFLFDTFALIVLFTVLGTGLGVGIGLLMNRRQVAASSPAG